MSAPFQWSNLNPVCEPAQIASQQILRWKSSSPSLAKIGNIANVSEQDQQLGCESWSICIIIIIINNLFFSSPSTPTILT